LPVFALILACSPKPKQVEALDATDVVRFETDDQEMNEAIINARDSFTKFEEAFESNKAGLNSFAIKMQFSDVIGGSEHLWIVDIVKRDDGYYGNVGNEPESTTEIVYGQHIKIEEGRISDWMYLENNALRGGNTLRVIRNRMSAAEQKQFDEQTGFTIED
jgi:uncharacterized protein YegJ (DUF2314 family)